MMYRGWPSWEYQRLYDSTAFGIYYSPTTIRVPLVVVAYRSTVHVRQCLQYRKELAQQSDVFLPYTNVGESGMAFFVGSVRLCTYLEFLSTSTKEGRGEKLQALAEQEEVAFRYIDMLQLEEPYHNDAKPHNFGMDNDGIWRCYDPIYSTRQ